MTDYLRRILNARVYDVARETPLERAGELSLRLGNTLMIKREDLQEVFSFKIRGAYNKMVNLSEAERSRGVIASSAGNHAQGVALAANTLGCDAVIVMPTSAPSMKVDAVLARGAEVVLFGDSYSDAYTHAQTLMVERDLTFVHPFDDPDVIAGQGTVGMEILRQHARPIHAIFVAVGGGGLISGVAAYVKQVRPDIKVIGVQHAESTAMKQSLEAGRPVELSDVGLFSDGTAVRRVGDETFRLVEQYVDDMLVVDTDETCAAIKDVFVDTRALLEPAGALAVAGAKLYAASTGIENETLVAIACGANINFDRLRFVSERAEVGEHHEAVFAVTIPEERGTFRRFCELVGDRDLTEFNYRIDEGSDAHVFVGIRTRTYEERADLADLFRGARFPATDLTKNELAKAHVRHLVGGTSPLAAGELLYRFEFPERPGALMRFLAAMRPEWNISLFHYRSHGADTARVLVGIQIPPGDDAALDEFIAGLGYRAWNETGNEAYQIFLATGAGGNQEL